MLAMVGWMLLAAGLVAPAHAQEPVAATGATLVIHIQDVSPRGGMLRLGLYDEARYPDDDAVPVASADVRAETGETIITLNNVPPGIYAIETFQDINSNNKMDTAIFLPKEGFGFSQNPVIRFGPPRFDKVSIEFPPGFTRTSVRMQYLL